MVWAPDNKHGGLEFLLPGQLKLNEGKSGSSYATAFASGLAAIFLLAIKVWSSRKMRLMNAHLGNGEFGVPRSASLCRFSAFYF